MNPEGSVEKLVAALKENTPANYVKIIKEIQLTKKDVAPYISWQEGTYTRNCIDRTEDFELILICWDAGIVTPVHDHNDQKCWIYHIDGILEETRYKKDDREQLVPSNEMRFSAGSLSYMDDTMGFHSLATPQNERAISLHLYAAPIDFCKVYDRTTEAFTPKSLSYHSFQGKPLEVSID